MVLGHEQMIDKTLLFGSSKIVGKQAGKKPVPPSHSSQVLQYAQGTMSKQQVREAFDALHL